jgi:hypothetical protein
MNDKLKDLTDNLKAITDDARSSFGQLSPEQLNWKPAAKSWSVAQCMDHLILTNSEFFGEIDEIIAGTRKNSFFENYSPLTGWWGRFLIKAVTEGSRPARAPSKRIEPPSDIESDIVERYCRHQDELVEKVSRTGNADWEKTVLTSPFLPVMTYKMADAYVVLVQHSKRHINQAKRVMETEGFPG